MNEATEAEAAAEKPGSPADGEMSDPGAEPHVNPWAALAVGVGGAVVGLMPWLTTGIRLPLQNLWAVEILPGDMPRSLLPLNQYFLVLVIGLLVTGATAAGMLVRGFRPSLGQRGRAAVFAGMMIVQLTAVVQAIAVTRSGLEQSTAARTYLTGVSGTAVLALLCGIAVFWLIVAAPRAGALIGFTVGALALEPWLTGLLHPRGWVPTGTVAEAIGGVSRLVPWVPSVLIGVAIGWCAMRSVGRVAAAVTSVLLLWAVPPLSSAIQYAAGSRVFGGSISVMIDAARTIFVIEATAFGAVALRVAVAIIAACIAWLVLHLHGERTSR